MKPHRTKGSPNPVLLQREHSKITVDRLQVALEVGFVTADKRMCLEEAARKVCALEEELEASRRSMQFLKTTGGGGGGGGGGSDTSARERAEALEVASRSATEAIAKRDDQMAFLLHRIKELEDANLAAAETLASRDMQIATLVAWSDASRAQLEELRRDLEAERRATEELRRALPLAHGDEFSAASPDGVANAAYADVDDDGYDAHHHHHLPSASPGIDAQPLLAAEAAVATHQSASPAQTALSSLELLASIDNEEEGEEEVLEKKGEKEELGEEVYIQGAGEKADDTFEGKEEELQEEQVQQKEKEEGVEGEEEDVVVKTAVGIEGEVHDVAEETGGVVEGTPGDGGGGGGGGVEEGEEAAKVEEVVVAPRPLPATPVTSASPPPQTPSPAPPPTPPQVHLSFSPKSRVDFKPSHSCTICHRPFGLLRSQRNCRVCEKSVCHDCSPSRVLAVDKSETKARRVCNACVAGLFVPQQQQQQEPVPSASPLSASSPPPKMDSLR